MVEGLPRRCHQRLALWRNAGLERTLSPRSPSPGRWVVRNGRRLLNLASNNYLGLADDPRVVEAAREAVARWGAGAGGSRLLCGDTDAHRRLEAELARLKGTEAALVFSSGYAANVGLLSALASSRDTIVLDALCHASLLDGAKLSGARLYRYEHRNVEQLESLLDSAGSGRRIVVTDALFSMDADFAPLAELVAVAQRHGATLVADDAHGTGAVGPEGRGSLAHLGVEGQVPVVLGTLSKAIGMQGGFVAGSRDLVNYLIERCRAFVYSTGLAPAIAEAAVVAIEILRREGWRREQLQRHHRVLREGLEERGYRVLHEPAAPMLLVQTGSARRTLWLARHLEQRGILVAAIRWPTVPKGTGRIRISPMATHTDADIEAVVASFPPAEEVPGE